MERALRDYLVVTAGYWSFTVTDGALRMLVVLHFHRLGYTPFEVAMLFLFYEFFGIVTNLVGGWLGARLGLDRTMHFGMALQVAALAMLLVPAPWLSVPYVMAAQALSGIAKDLNKMSAKASVKALAGHGAESRLFSWVAVLTGSKNALKGAGFFVGAALLQGLGFRGALLVLAGLLALVLAMTWWLLPRGLGRMSAKPKFGDVFSRIAAVNWLAAARLFLFAARDVWFVVGLPVFLYDRLGWTFLGVGAFLALWVIGYGLVQAAAPTLLRAIGRHAAPGGGTARAAVFGLTLIPAGIAVALGSGWPTQAVVIVGLVLFGVVFAFNSAVHSYLVLAYADADKVAMNVGFYYMANAGGRLLGTVLSGYAYQSHGLSGCLWWSTALLGVAGLCSLALPAGASVRRPPARADGGV
ncbi:MAG: organoarsenical effux MFS transporter ArsJ [Gammaproteobacteria bacterium]